MLDLSIFEVCQVVNASGRLTTESYRKGVFTLISTSLVLVQNEIWILISFFWETTILQKTVWISWVPFGLQELLDELDENGSQHEELVENRP